MLYCLNPEDDEPIMLLTRHVGYDKDDGMGIDGNAFAAELIQLDGMNKKRIQIWINSPGGVVMDGYNIYTAILRIKTKVDTYCTGIAASIAAVIFQAGRLRVMSDYSKLMYHEPFGGASTELEPITDSLAIMIASRVSKAKDEILAIMKRTTWISASEAFTSGFCDTVEVSSEHNKKRANSVSEPKAFWRESNLIINSILNIKNNIDMSFKKINSRLGLNEDASEESALKTLDAIENKAKIEAENSLKLIKDKDEELTKIKNEMTAKNTEMAQLKKDKEDSEAKAKLESEKAEGEKVKNMVEGFAKSGRIKNDAATIQKWVDNAKDLGATGHDKIKAMLDEIPLNKVAPKINVNDVNDAANLTGVIAKAMAEKRQELKV